MVVVLPRFSTTSFKLNSCPFCTGFNALELCTTNWGREKGWDIGVEVGGIGVGATAVKQLQETSGSVPLDIVTVWGPTDNPAGTVAVITKSF